MDREHVGTGARATGERGFRRERRALASCRRRDYSGHDELDRMGFALVVLTLLMLLDCLARLRDFASWSFCAARVAHCSRLAMCPSRGLDGKRDTAPGACCSCCRERCHCTVDQVSIQIKAKRTWQLHFLLSPLAILTRLRGPDPIFWRDFPTGHGDRGPGPGLIAVEESRM